MERLASARSEAYAPAARPQTAWLAAGLAFSLLMLAVHALAGLHTAGVPDAWRDWYWATRIARGEAFPLIGPPIYGLIELGPWWFYLLSVPVALFGRVAAVAVFVQLLVALKYGLAWRLGTRLVDARFGLACAVSLALAGWSTIPLMFPSHTAMIETTLLLLAAAMWRCWLRLSLGNALLYGLAAGACLNAHPTTAAYVLGGGVALLIHHRAWTAFAWLAVAAAIAALTLAPPWLDGAVAHGGRSVVAYVAGDLGVDAWRRLPALAASALVDGAWNGFLLMTRWNLGFVRAAWFAYGACLAVSACGLVALVRARPHLRVVAIVAAAVFVGQAIFLVLLRPITPMWMLSSLLPPLAMLIGLGWYGGIVASHRALRIAAGAGLVLFGALSLAPFGLYLRNLDSLRVAPGVNPYLDAVETSARYIDVAVPYVPVYGIDRLAPFLCEAETLHSRLAVIAEQTLAVPMRLACGFWPELRYGGREGAVHLAGIFERSARAAAIAPDRVVAGLALYSRVTPIAPAIGAGRTILTRDQIHANYSAAPATKLDYAFETASGDVVVLTNRFPGIAPIDMHRVEVDGRPARRLDDDGGSTIFGCDACLAGSSAHWHLELGAVEGNIDLVVLRH